MSKLRNGSGVSRRAFLAATESMATVSAFAPSWARGANGQSDVAANRMAKDLLVTQMIVTPIALPDPPLLAA
jgi:hypothetical protein